MHYLFSGNETPDEIKRILLENCEGTETMQYTKKLSEDELAGFREGYVNNNLEMAGHVEELQAAKDHFKTVTKPLKEDSKLMLRVLKTRHLEITGTCYKLPNFDTGMMEYVSDTGEIVSTRRLLPEEKQGSMIAELRKVV
jgi:hypothetical protein